MYNAVSLGYTASEQRPEVLISLLQYSVQRFLSIQLILKF